MYSAVLVCLLAAGDVRAEWFVDASSGLSYDSNAPRAQLDADIEEDAALYAGVSPGYFFQVDDRTGISLVADLNAEESLGYSGLDNVSAGIGASIRTKLGLGLAAPWIRAAVSINHEDFDHAQRDAWRYGASAAAGMRLGQRCNVQLGYSFERRRADDVIDIPFLAENLGIGGEAWDTDGHSASVGSVCDLSDRLSLVLGYTRRMGQVTSTTRINQEIFEASDAITPDEVFGNDRFAYRMDADTDIFSVGLSWALGDHASVNVGYGYQDTAAEYGVKYANHLGHFDILFSY